MPASKRIIITSEPVSRLIDKQSRNDTLFAE
jgi:hypothetical protein